VTRLNRVEHRFVEFVPDPLEPGIVYVSVEYATVVHLCCCGCGNKVVTPLSPAQWKLNYDGEAISLTPSVGSGALACNSHYFITRNEVRWAKPLTKQETAAALRRDQSVTQKHYVPEPAATGHPRKQKWWRRLWSRIRRATS
jgi:hypothetical protein